ncbi:MAG: hypothetical protein D6806_00480, partial [Deltaproteobacteria bacterium]
DNLASGAPCGSHLDTECDNPDTCDGSGNCLANHELAGTPCTDDGNVCTDDVCDGSGQCTHPNNTAPCDDGLFCNGADSCSGGSCSVHTGDPCAGPDGDSDCSESCDDVNDNCTANDPDNSLCNDGVFCTVGDKCIGGTCTGSPNPCDDGIPCTQDSCNDTTDKCDHVPIDSLCDNGQYCDGAEWCDPAAGCRSGSPPCDDGIACTDDSCDEVSKSCTNTANDTHCTTPDMCVPDCSPDSTGCVTPPASVGLTCENPAYLDVDNVSDCTLTLAGGDNLGQENCISCSASVGVTTLSTVAFSDDANQGQCDYPSAGDGKVDGWTLVQGWFCYAAGDSCPMSDPNGLPEGRNCCDNLICPLDNGPLQGTIAFQADRDTCTNGDRQWRLQRTFDTTGLQNLQLCFDYADQGTGGNNDAVQIDVFDQSNYSAGVFCDTDGPRAGVDGAWFNQCVSLPQFANDNPAVTVAFFVHSNDNNDRIFIDNITLRGESIACPAVVDTPY